MKLSNGRTCSMVLRGLAIFGAFVLVTAQSVTAVAQPAPARAVQGTDGNLYLVQGGTVWHLVPDQISDSDIAALSPSGEVDGMLGGQPTPLRAVQGTDSTLYLVQGSNSWTLVPDQISDLDLATLSPSGEVDGLIPNQFVVVPAPPPTPAAAPTNPPSTTPTPGPTAAPESIIVTKEVPGTSGPWLYAKGGLNSAYPYTENEPKGFPTSPTVFNASDGLTFKSGTVLHVRYVSGGTGQSAGYALSDGNGNQKERPPVCPDPRPFPYGHCPSVYVSGAHNVMELLGVFTDQSGAIVGKPVVVGNSADLTIPDGASALSLGVNDSGYFNNIGSMQVAVH